MADGPLSYLSIAGIPVALGSFLIYVYSAMDVFLASFLVGIAMIIVGYVYVVHTSSRLDKDLESRFFQLEQAGYIIALDDSYVPWGDQATIESLENRRCPL